MPIDPATEPLIPLSRARRELPAAPAEDTLLRYHRQGVISKRTGERVKLDALQVGSSWYTSRQAWLRFIAQLNGGELA